MSLKSDAQFEEKLTCGLRNLANFQQSTGKCQKRNFPFVQSRKCMSLKFTEELFVMTMKNDAKFEEELTCRSKIDIRNLGNFDPST